MPMSGETSSKTRIRATGQTLVRVDRGDGRVSDGTLPARIEEVLCHAGTVLVSDYGRGVAAHSRIRRLLGALPDGVPVVWDPHPNGPRPLPGARLVTPNESEARALAGEHPSTEPTTNPFARAAVDSDLLVRRWRVTGVAVTLGANGALLSVGEANPYLAPIPSAEVTVPQVDGCGAGDCFAAAATHVLHGREPHRSRHRCRTPVQQLRPRGWCRLPRRDGENHRIARTCPARPSGRRSPGPSGRRPGRRDRRVLRPPARRPHQPPERGAPAR